MTDAIKVKKKRPAAPNALFFDSFILSMPPIKKGWYISINPTQPVNNIPVRE
eukprot:CAMPEP_0198136772 /NCGR_PEP_ID=MMETSP1443-20131203/382_1 /TAXON_ID=186043 /ORGANISM="Entomoneis sp., Strain CCMP2396" /LENGTH=51 /DNA_ID=CAMNT_0043798047 /DNA_START=508 /DNA_END=663 /DNA_ORIENTATION=-